MKLICKEMFAYAKLPHRVDNWCNVVANSSRRWERMYVEGQWDFLTSQRQRARHYVVSGIIRDRFPSGASVRDVGCGYGILYSLLNDSRFSYTGIDFANHAIAECLSRYGSSNNCEFKLVAFGSFYTMLPFDVVVMNEVLYYFPLRSIVEVFSRALSLLRRTESSLVVMSMSSNLKASCIRRRLRSVATEEQSISVRSEKGDPWNIRVYRPIAKRVVGAAE